MRCIECENEQKKVTEKIERAKTNGVKWAKKYGIKEIVIVKGAFGIPTAYATTDEMRKRFESIEYLSVQ